MAENIDKNHKESPFNNFDENSQEDLKKIIDKLKNVKIDEQKDLGEQSKSKKEDQNDKGSGGGRG